jgi:hypothetical protein
MAAPTVAIASPTSLFAVMRSPMNDAKSTVRTGLIVGTINAPSDAGVIVSATKTRAL